MDAVWVGTASALARGRRLRTAGTRLRHRTTPVTFAEIKEVDEESAEAEACEERCGGTSARRRPDVLEERLGKQFTEFRRRRADRRGEMREREHESPPPPGGTPLDLGGAPPTTGGGPSCVEGAPPSLLRADSEPSALHHSDTDT